MWLQVCAEGGFTQANSNAPVPGVSEPVTLQGLSDTDEFFSSSHTDCEDLLLQLEPPSFVSYCCHSYK